MKRRLANVVITAYILALFGGFMTMSLHLAIPGQTFLYFVTFNMFSGWSCFEARAHIIGEGASGTFYELGPPPWGEFDPYGPPARQHYDPHMDKEWPIADNTLRHTSHEPMTRIYIIEEEYPKRLNLPDAQYQAYYHKPKAFHSYYNVRFVMDSQGKALGQQFEWLAIQDKVSVMDNPRLLADASKHTPLELTDQTPANHGVFAVGRFFEPPPSGYLGSPLAE
jgi:hypothetical protein